MIFFCFWACLILSNCIFLRANILTLVVGDLLLLGVYGLEELGGFQLLDLIITELKSPMTSGLLSLGVPSMPWHTQILADQLTPFQPGGTDCAHLITTGIPGFSALPTALQACGFQHFLLHNPYICGLCFILTSQLAFVCHY